MNCIKHNSYGNCFLKKYSFKKKSKKKIKKKNQKKKSKKI